MVEWYVQETLGGEALLTSTHPGEGSGDEATLTVPDECSECGKSFMAGQQVNPDGPIHVDCDDYIDDYDEQDRLLAEMDNDDTGTEE